MTVSVANATHVDGSENRMTSSSIEPKCKTFWNAHASFEFYAIRSDTAGALRELVSSAR